MSTAQNTIDKATPFELIELSFDGSNKGVSGGKDIKYWEMTSEENERLKAEIIAKASPEAIAYLDPLNYKGPKVLIDAATLSHDGWLKYRRNYIGTSDASHIFGDCPFAGGTNVDLYYNKLGLEPTVTLDEDEQSSREQMFDYGHLAEAYLQGYVTRKYRHSELVIDSNIYADPKRPFIAADLDGMLRIPKDGSGYADGPYVHIEFKTTNKFNSQTYKGDEIPTYYKRQLVQSQHIMGVWVSYLIVMFDRDDIRVYRYERDLDYEMEQIKETENFWMNNILAKIEPPYLGPAKNLKECIKNYGSKADKSVPEKTLDATFLDAAAEYEKHSAKITDLNRQLKYETEQRDFAGLTIAKEMNAATRGYVSDGKRAFAIKYDTRNGARRCDFDRLEVEHPEIFKEYVRRSDNTRPMSISKANPR